MAAPQGPTSLTLSGIVDGQTIDAADVTTPFNETETAIDEARETVAISSADTTVKYLEDAITAGTGITVTKQNAGGNESIQISGAGGSFAALSDTPADYTDAAGDVPTVNAGETGLEFGPAIPAGSILPSFVGTAPAGWLLCSGQTVSMTTYKRLLSALISGANVISTYGGGTANTITADAATDKILWSAHGLSNGTVIMFTNSGGALPTPIAVNTPYYVINAATNDFQISLTEGGSSVDISDAGTGTHSAYTSFKVPDMRGRAFVGLDNMGGSSANVVTSTAADSMGNTAGAENHTLIIGEIPSHTHSIALESVAAYPSNAGYSAKQGTSNTGSAGGGGAHNNMQPSMFGNWIIKT